MEKVKYACLFSGIGAPLQGIYRVFGKEVVEHIFSCEWDSHARKSFKAIYGINDDTFYKDIHDFDARKYQGQVDVLAWGFPCTSYSVSGKRLGLDDPNTGDLFHEGLRILQEVKPKWTFIENVRGLLSIDKGETIRMILRDLASAGYRIDMDCVTTEDYGVPQSRERVYIIGERIDQ